MIFEGLSDRLFGEEKVGTVSGGVFLGRILGFGGQLTGDDRFVGRKVLLGSLKRELNSDWKCVIVI